MINSIGILAYGSLIDDPGPELESLITSSLNTKTPFEIEYGRKSSTRGNAPTLTVVKTGGVQVNAKILVLNSKVTLGDAKNMLYRRERRLANTTTPYKEPGINSVRMRIRELQGFQDLISVVYVDLASNIECITPEILAVLAIESALTDAGDKKTDGINYLMNNIDNGIVTPLTLLYKQEILRLTNASTLLQAIEVCNTKRIATISQ